MQAILPMVKTTTRAIISITTLLLAGCAPLLTKNECQNFNFYEIGLNDGNAGKSINEFSKYQSTCNEYKITLDRKSYENGWRHGNESFCQPSTAFTMGKRGVDFPNACSDFSNSELRNEYNRGRQIYNRMQIINGQIADIDRQMYGSDQLRRQVEQSRFRILELQRARDATDDKAQKQSYQNQIFLEEDNLSALNNELIVKTTLEISQRDNLQRRKDKLIQELQTLEAEK